MEVLEPYQKIGQLPRQPSKESLTTAASKYRYASDSAVKRAQSFPHELHVRHNFNDGRFILAQVDPILKKLKLPVIARGSTHSITVG